MKALRASTARTEAKEAPPSFKQRNLAQKRAAPATKRAEKLQLKMDEALLYARAEQEQRKQIVKQVLAEGRAELEKPKRQYKDMQLSVEGKLCQRGAQTAVFAGT